jgi:asparagine synthase (glutamine-hydrolysing)
MFRGTIDFTRMTGPAPAGMRAGAAVQAGESATHFALPGVSLDWDPRRADVAVDRNLVALTTRGHRTAGTASGMTPAAAWLHGFRSRGEHAADDFDGGFAAVLVDLDQRRAWLFVDRFAIETLCYRAAGTVLTFADRATEVRVPGTSIDAQSLFHYLYFHMIPAPRTAFRQVERVPGGHVAAVSAAGVRTSRYWHPVFVETDDRDVARRMRQFIDAVRESVAHDADDTGTACFLSGGTDSSTIAGMLTRIRGKPADAYSIGFESEGYDEMAYARIAVRHFGLAHHEYYVTPDDVLAAIPRLAASLDQPFGNSSVLPAYFCALRAHEDGFTRMLAGDGGDELFGGNSRYALQRVFHLYHALPPGLRTTLLEPAAMHWPLFTRVPGVRKLGGYVRHARQPMPDRMETFNLLNRLGAASVFEPDFLARVDPARPLLEQREVWSEASTPSLTNRMLAYDWKYTLADSDLPKVRSATELAGVSVRYPLLSRSLTDLSLTLPPHWKVRGMQLRWFFKRALRDFLPREIITKKKHGFGLPFGPWVVRHGHLRDFVLESLHGIGSRGIVRKAFVDELMSRRLAEAPGYYGEMAWLLMMLEQWFRSHVDYRFAQGPEPEPSARAASVLAAEARPSP